MPCIIFLRAPASPPAAPFVVNGMAPVWGLANKTTLHGNSLRASAKHAAALVQFVPISLHGIFVDISPHVIFGLWHSHVMFCRSQVKASHRSQMQLLLWPSRLSKPIRSGPASSCHPARLLC